MRKLLIFVVVWLTVAAGVGMKSTPAAADPSARQAANEVRSIFAAKCAICHGPDVEHPKCRFGYVTDLSRVAANPEIVIPASPEESELWTLVSRGEMPPSDSPHGTLSAKQKELIRSWIKNGAPDPSASE
ncbi:MAG TPA: c-type cytochrome domain-containing protein, partial [Pirellulales bacterium]|nr:c-type cytochrome domain-containing protein [Pirellulales bacterium]